jgi:fucose permease
MKITKEETQNFSSTQDDLGFFLFLMFCVYLEYGILKGYLKGYLGKHLGVYLGYGIHKAT